MKVERWHLHESTADGAAWMIPAASGEWVRASEVAKLEADLAEERAKRERFAEIWCQNFETEQRARVAMQTDRDSLRADLEAAAKALADIADDVCRECHKAETARAALARAGVQDALRRGEGGERG